MTIRIVPLTTALLVAAASASAAQCCRPTFELDEITAGAAGNAVLRGPWVTTRWRKPLPRLALFTLGSLTYERFVDHSGWNWSDFNQRLVSYLLTEAIVSGVLRLRRRPVHPSWPAPPLAWCGANPPRPTKPPWLCQPRYKW